MGVSESSICLSCRSERNCQTQWTTICLLLASVSEARQILAEPEKMVQKRFGPEIDQKMVIVHSLYPINRNHFVRNV